MILNFHTNSFFNLEENMKKLFVSLLMLAVVAGSSAVFAQQETKACDKQKTECAKSCDKQKTECAKADDKKCCKEDSKDCCKNKKDGDATKCCSEKKTEKKTEKKSSGKKIIKAKK